MPRWTAGLVALMCGACGSANVVAPADAPPVNANEPQEIENAEPQPKVPPPKTKAEIPTRPLGTREISGRRVSAELDLPWKPGDAPRFRVRAEGGRMRLDALVADNKGTRLVEASRLVGQEGEYFFHPIIKDMKAGSYVLIVTAIAAIHPESASFEFRLP